jgi:hypothetical protein
LYSRNTVKVTIAVRGEDVTYGTLSLTPDVDSRADGIDVRSFRIRRGNDRYLFEDMPVSKALHRETQDDIIYHTFEADEGDRQPHLAIDFVIPLYDETMSINFRAVERDGIPDMLFFEVEDDGGDWLSVNDVKLADLLPDSFLRILETSVMESLTDHNIAWLPMTAES